jgi:hypothetical protein
MNSKISSLTNQICRINRVKMDSYQHVHATGKDPVYVHYNVSIRSETMSNNTKYLIELYDFHPLDYYDISSIIIINRPSQSSLSYF